MSVKTKFYLYLLITIVLSSLLVSVVLLIYQAPNGIDALLFLLINYKEGRIGELGLFPHSQSRRD